MNSALVSVILPTYNRAHFLAEAVESALSQTYTNLEVVVVDDGSADNTTEVLTALAAKDARVRHFKQKNGGVSAARNRSLQEARGTYVAFLDSDDVWRNWKLELQMQLLNERPEVGMVWTDMDAILPDGTPYQQNYLRTMYSAYKRVPKEELFPEYIQLPGNPQFGVASIYTGVGDIYPKMFHGNLVHTSTVLLRKEWADRVGPFDQTMLRGGEDFKYHLATCRQGSVALINVASILYRTGMSDQITSARNNLFFARSYLRTLSEELATERQRLPLSDREIDVLLADAHDWLSYESVSNGERYDAITHSLSAMRLRRRLGSSWKTLIKAFLPRWVLRQIRRPAKRYVPTDAATPVEPPHAGNLSNMKTTARSRDKVASP